MKTTEQNNEMIAVFMGGLWNEHSSMYGIGNAEYRYFGLLKNVVSAIDHFEISELKYNTSWDWLMPVVENIGNLGICYGDEGYLLIECIHSNLLEVNIAVVHEAICQFIEWYNENKN